MKAAQLIQYGGKEAVSINDITLPEVGEGKVLIEVHAAGINPFDWKLQNGYSKAYIPVTFPLTMGGDLAGVVKEVGSGVSQFRSGDEVYGQAYAISGGSGTFAEFAITKPGTLALKPKKINFEQAGALPLVGVSALQALTEHINLQKDQKVLVHGGAGGIGSIAIQIAKHIGAFVATTVSANDVEYVKQLGADEVIDYKNQKFEDAVSEYDAVFDTVGGETAKRSIEILKSGGILVSMVGPVYEERATAKNIIARVQQTRVSTERLNKLAELVEQGIVTVNVEKSFPLDQAAEALDYLKNTPPKGKVVIVIDHK